LLTDGYPNKIADCPSSDWLGGYSPNDIIRHAGLWNVNYIGDTYDQAFLDLLEKYIRRM